MRTAAYTTLGLLGLSILVSHRVAAQEPARAPACELNRSYFLVEQAETYFIGAHEEKTEQAREEMRDNAERSLLEAVERGEVDNAAVWYFLGRIYQMKGDLAGMDSAFTAAQRLAPDCAEDIDYYRQVMWVPLINQALDSLRSGAFDGAKTVLRDAIMLRPMDNLGHYYLARIFANDGDFDIAMLHFRTVIDLGLSDDDDRNSNYVTSLQSMGDLFAGLSEWDSAVVYYQRLRESGAGKPGVIVNLAQAHDNAGDAARAMELYRGVVDQSEAMDATTLFETGRALYLAERFDLAATAFEHGLEKNPHAVAAMYDLANSYRAQAQGEGVSNAPRSSATASMQAIATQIIEVDPLSAEALRLLAAAHQMQSHTAATDQILARIGRLVVELEIYYAEASGGTFNIQGRFRNVRNRQVTVPQITFEFLRADGEVAETKTVGGEIVEANGSTRFSITATAVDVVGYRYQIGS